MSNQGMDALTVARKYITELEIEYQRKAVKINRLFTDVMSMGVTGIGEALFSFGVLEDDFDLPTPYISGNPAPVDQLNATQRQLSARPYNRGFAYSKFKENNAIAGTKYVQTNVERLYDSFYKGYDYSILDAFTGDATQINSDGKTELISLPVGNIVAAAGTAFTKAKLLDMINKCGVNEWNTSLKRYILCSETQMGYLLDDLKMDGDYVAPMKLEEINNEFFGTASMVMFTWRGFWFINTPDSYLDYISTVPGETTAVLCNEKSIVSHMGMFEMADGAKINPYDKTIYFGNNYGAVRKYEKGVFIYQLTK